MAITTATINYPNQDSFTYKSYSGGSLTDICTLEQGGQQTRIYTRDDGICTNEGTESAPKYTRRNSFPAKAGDQWAVSGNILTVPNDTTILLRRIHQSRRISTFGCPVNLPNQQYFSYSTLQVYYDDVLVIGFTNAQSSNFTHYYTEEGGFRFQLFDDGILVYENVDPDSCPIVIFGTDTDCPNGTDEECICNGEKNCYKLSSDQKSYELIKTIKL